MNLDNILRTMNEYLNDIFNTFGGQSNEYSTAVRQVRENLNDEVLQQVTRQGLDYKADAPDKPLQFSRGKQAKEILNNFQGDLTTLRAEQRKQGTAKVQAQRYYIEQKLDMPDMPVSTEKLTKQAQQRYDFNNNVNDWYEEIDNAAELTELEKSGIKEMYSTLNEDYSDPAVRENIRNKATELIAKAKNRRKQAKTDTANIPVVMGVGTDLKHMT